MPGHTISALALTTTLYHPQSQIRQLIIIFSSHHHSCFPHFAYHELVNCSCAWPLDYVVNAAATLQATVGGGKAQRPQSAGVSNGATLDGVSKQLWTRPFCDCYHICCQDSKASRADNM
jgi:hypothetical protein